MTRTCIFLLLSSTLTLCGFVPALGEDVLASGDPSRPYVIEWSGGNKNVDELMLNERKLVVSLHNVGRLPSTTVHVGDEGIVTPQALTRQGIPFLEWSDEVDNVVCDLNPKNCSRPHTPVDDASLNNLLSHVGGFAITPQSLSKWTVHLQDEIVVPKLDFESSTRWQSFNVTDSSDLRALYEKRALGCVVLDIATTKFTFPGSITDFRRTAAASDDTSCIGRIVNVNTLNWASLSFLKELSDPEKRSDTQNLSFNKMNESANEILSSTNADSAWEKLNRLSETIYSDLPASGLKTVQLPVLSLRTTFDVEAIPTYATESQNDLVFNSGWLKRLQSLPPEDVFSSLGQSIDVDLILPKTPYIGQPDAVMGTDNEGIVLTTIEERQIKSVLEPINVWTKSKAFLDDNNFSRAIIFVDDGLVLTHCVFAGGCSPSWVDRAALDQPAAPEKVLFDRIKFELGKMSKTGAGHGLGVAAVATANPASGGMIGIDPKARPIPFDLNLSAWPTERFREKAGELVEKQAGTFLVWNISGHTTVRERISQIDKYLDDQLSQGGASSPTAQYFVFAAGNVPKDVVTDDLNTGDCSIFPACRSIGDKYRTVVTVVGAMLDENGFPMPWEDEGTGVATYANPKFEIAAIAKNVVIPSVTTEAYYTMDGTSYAAPQVSAVLLYLRTQLMAAAPEELVGRIVGCGRMSKALEGRVMGGLLDAECSLRFKQTQIAFEPKLQDEVDRDTARTLRPGKLLGVWTSDGTLSNILPIKDEDQGVTTDVRWWPEPNYTSIAGFRQLVDDPGKFNLTTWDAEGQLSSRVRRRFSSTLQLEILFDGDQLPTCIQAGQLLGYVPASQPYATSERDAISKEDSSCHFSTSN